MAVKPIPEGYHTLTAYLAVDDAATAIEFYKEAFGATERGRMDAPGGKIGHAELQIGDSVFMLSDPFPQSSVKSPKDAGTTTSSIFMYSEDVDAAIQRAVDAGATIEQEPTDMFWGDRFGSSRRPVRAPLGDRDAHRGRLARGDGRARQGRHGRNAELTDPIRGLGSRGQPTGRGGVVKGADKQKKLQKKKAQKTLKEKRAEKKAAKSAKTY